MKKQLFFLISFLSAISVQAQLGFSYGIQSMNARGWEQNFLAGKYEQSTGKVFPNTTYFSLSLTSLKREKRIRFSPSIGFSRYYLEGYYLGEEFASFVYPPKIDRYRALFVNINPAFDFYVFKPKDAGVEDEHLKFGQYLKSNFFFHLSPSYNLVYVKNKDRIAFFNVFGSDVPRPRFSLKTGLGMEFKIAKFLIVAPMFSYNFYVPINWYNFGELSPFLDRSIPALPSNKGRLHPVVSKVQHLTMDMKFVFVLGS